MPSAARNRPTEISEPSLIAGMAHGSEDGSTAKHPGTEQRMEHHGCNKALMCSSEGSLPTDGGWSTEPYAPSQPPGAEASSASPTSSLPLQHTMACPPSSQNSQSSQKQPPSFRVHAPDVAPRSRSRGSPWVRRAHASTISSAAKSRSPARPSVPAGARTSLRTRSIAVMKPKMVSVSLQWVGVVMIQQNM